jgi:L-fucose mutarotase
VLPLDDVLPADLMASADGEVLDVQRELLAAAGVSEDDARFVDRYAYYDVASSGYLIVRTGETRKYGNAILRKGIVT